MKYSEGNWKPGKALGTVISDAIPVDYLEHQKSKGREDIDHYGGWLICETVLNPSDQKLISAAPDLLKALQHVLSHAELVINCHHPHHKLAIAAIKKATE